MRKQKMKVWAESKDVANKKLNIVKFNGLDKALHINLFMGRYKGQFDGKPKQYELTVSLKEIKKAK